MKSTDTKTRTSSFCIIQFVIDFAERKIWRFRLCFADIGKMQE